MSKAKDCRSDEVLERRPRSTAILERGIEALEDLNEFITAVLLDQNEGIITTAAATNHLRGANVMVQVTRAGLQIIRLSGVSSAAGLLPLTRKKKETLPHANGNGDAQGHR